MEVILLTLMLLHRKMPFLYLVCDVDVIGDDVTMTPRCEKRLHKKTMKHRCELLSTLSSYHSASDRKVEYIVMSMSVCLSVCLSQEQHVKNLMFCVCCCLLPRHG